MAPTSAPPQVCYNPSYTYSGTLDSSSQMRLEDCLLDVELAARLTITASIPIAPFGDRTMRSGWDRGRRSHLYPRWEARDPVLPWLHKLHSIREFYQPGVLGIWMANQITHLAFLNMLANSAFSACNCLDKWPQVPWKGIPASLLYTLAGVLTSLLISEFLGQNTVSGNKIYLLSSPAVCHNRPGISPWHEL